MQLDNMVYVMIAFVLKSKSAGKMLHFISLSQSKLISIPHKVCIHP